MSLSSSNEPSSLPYRLTEIEYETMLLLIKTALGVEYAEKDVAAIAPFFKVLIYPPNHVVYREGDPIDCCGIVSKGRLVERTVDLDGDVYVKSDKIVNECFGGELLGAATTSGRSSTMSAPIQCRALLLSADSYAQMVVHLGSVGIDATPLLQYLSPTWTQASLRRMPMFAAMADNVVECLAAMVHIRVIHKANESVINEGDDTDRSMYLVVKGELQATSGTVDDPIVLNVFTSGMFFGETSLLISIPRTSNVVSTAPSIVLTLSKDDFDRSVKAEPAISKQFQKRMQERVCQQFRKYRVNFFDALSDDDLLKISSKVSIEIIEANTTIFRLGDQGDKFYMIVHGSVDLLTEKTTEKTTSTITSGQYFGEIAMISDQPRAGTAITATRCVVLTLRRSQFAAFFNQGGSLERAGIDLKLRLPANVNIFKTTSTIAPTTRAHSTTVETSTTRPKSARVKGFAARSISCSRPKTSTSNAKVTLTPIAHKNNRSMLVNLVARSAPCSPRSADDTTPRGALTPIGHKKEPARATTPSRTRKYYADV